MVLVAYPVRARSSIRSSPPKRMPMCGTKLAKLIDAMTTPIPFARKTARITVHMNEISFASPIVPESSRASSQGDPALSSGSLLRVSGMEI